MGLITVPPFCICWPIEHWSCYCQWRRACDHLWQHTEEPTTTATVTCFAILWNFPNYCGVRVAPSLNFGAFSSKMSHNITSLIKYTLSSDLYIPRFIDDIQFHSGWIQNILNTQANACYLNLFRNNWNDKPLFLFLWNDDKNERFYGSLYLISYNHTRGACNWANIIHTPPSVSCNGNSARFVVAKQRKVIAQVIWRTRCTLLMAFLLFLTALNFSSTINAS